MPKFSAKILWNGVHMVVTLKPIMLLPFITTTNTTAAAAAATFRLQATVC